jgi:hypothetical protein
MGWRRGKNHLITLTALSAVILFIAAGSADAASSYTLKVLVKVGDTIGGKTLTIAGLPAINDSGTVAFFGGFSDGS